jgi:NAD(P)-dependent dehydrogenase (short-subunit alcohol dehydrogenase family)
LTSSDAEAPKVAWVTGASRGTGADTAVRLAECSYHVALTARAQKRLAWLVRSPDAVDLLSKRINLPTITHKYGLLSGWEGPGTPFTSSDAAPLDLAER